MKLNRVLSLVVVLSIETGYAVAQVPTVARPKNEAYERTLQEGLDFYERGKFEEAATMFKRATQLGPRESEVFNSLGIALARLNRPHEAIVALQKAVQLDPQNFDARFNLARRYRVAGRLPEAVKELVVAVEVRPEYVAAWNELGEALVRMSKKDLSRIEREIKINAQVSLSYFTLGYIAYRMGRFDQSAIHLKEAIALNPRFSGARNLLGLVYFEQRKEKEAMGELERAVATEPAYEIARYNLALLCIANGLREEALRHLQTLESLDSSLASPLLNLLTGDRVVNVRDLLRKK